MSDATVEVAVAAPQRCAPALRRDQVHSNAQHERNHAKLIGVVRRFMVEGTFNPSAERIAGAAGLSMRSLYNHFGSAAEIWEAALDDETKRLILSLVMPNGPWPCSEDCSRIVRAIVWGRLTR